MLYSSINSWWTSVIWIVNPRIMCIGVSLSNLSINPDRGLLFVAKSNNLDNPKPHRGSLFVP